MRFLTVLFVSCLALLGCQETPAQAPKNAQPLQVGAANFQAYVPALTGKRVGLVVNQTSVVNGQHLVDALLDKGVVVSKIFAPEHGFRGDHDAGAHVKSTVDAKTGIDVVSIYGSNKKPSPEMLADLDVIIFDIQDVGVRFYTYISSMHYV
ncbi:MAG: exo-beta-N-acetylmuramidase NamZ domain-containing protein, partial [Pseudoalteromonas shioyasakiensis]